MSLYAFHLGQIISTVLGQVDHGGEDANTARAQIRDATSETEVVGWSLGSVKLLPLIFLN